MNMTDKKDIIGGKYSNAEHNYRFDPWRLADTIRYERHFGVYVKWWVHMLPRTI